MDLATSPLSTVPGPTSTYVVTPSDARRRTTSSQRTGDDTCAISASIAAARRRASARRRRWRRPARADRATRSARSSGASRSSAGFISAQWNGALTGSGITRLAPSALARSPARATASRAPAITTWPRAVQVRGADHLALRRLRAGLRHVVGVESEDRRHRAGADRHRFLHVAAAAADDAHRIGKRQRAGRHVRRVLAQAVAGDKRRLDARATRAAGTRRCSWSGWPAACFR